MTDAVVPENTPLKFSSLVGVNGFDSFIERSGEVLKSSSEIASWFKKIGLMYEAHGKNLIKNAALGKKKKITSSVEIGSLSGAWTCFHTEMEEVGNVTLSCSQELISDVAERINVFVAEKTSVRKKLLVEVSKTSGDLKIQLSQLKKAKENFHSKCKDADAAQQAYSKAKLDGSIKPKKVQELNSKTKKCIDAATTADKEYNKVLEKTNEKQTRFYGTEMPSILEMFQAFEEERLQFLRSMFLKAAEIQNGMPTVFENFMTEIEKISQDICVRGDIQEFIEQQKPSLVPPPETVTYEPYETDNPDFQLDNTELLNDTIQVTHGAESNKEIDSVEKDTLTADERITLLSSQIEDLKETIKEETTSQTGMEKLVKFYSKDPKSKEKAVLELDDQVRKIEGLRNTLDTLVTTITELQPKQETVLLRVTSEWDGREACQSPKSICSIRL